MQCINIVGEHLGDDINNVERVDTVATHLEMIDGRLGGDFGVDDFGVPELAYPYVFDGVNDEGETATSSSFVQIEIVPK